jgi:hypothetical protein
MVLIDVTVPVPVIEDRAIEGFGADDGIAGGGATEEKEIFAFPLVVFTGAGGGCWAGSGFDFHRVSESCRGRFYCNNSGVRVARVYNAKVVVALRRAETLDMSRSSEVTCGGSKDTGKLL